VCRAVQTRSSSDWLADVADCPYLNIKEQEKGGGRMEVRKDGNVTRRGERGDEEGRSRDDEEGRGEEELGQ